MKSKYVIFFFIFLCFLLSSCSPPPKNSKNTPPISNSINLPKKISPEELKDTINFLQLMERLKANEYNSLKQKGGTEMIWELIIRPILYIIKKFLQIQIRQFLAMLLLSILELIFTLIFSTFTEEPQYKEYCDMPMEELPQSTLIPPSSEYYGEPWPYTDEYASPGGESSSYGSNKMFFPPTSTQAQGSQKGQGPGSLSIPPFSTLFPYNPNSPSGSGIHSSLSSASEKLSSSSSGSSDSSDSSVSSGSSTSSTSGSSSSEAPPLVGAILPFRRCKIYNVTELKQKPEYRMLLDKLPCGAPDKPCDKIYLDGYRFRDESFCIPFNLAPLTSHTSQTKPHHKPKHKQHNNSFIYLESESKMSTKGFVNLLLDPILERTIGLMQNSLKDILIPTLVASVRNHLGDELKINVNRTVHRSVSRTLTESLTANIAHAVVTQLSEVLRRSLPIVGSRKISQYLIPTLSYSLSYTLYHSLTHDPKSDYYCYYCQHHNLYCTYCLRYQIQQYYSNYYLHFYSHYYSQYYSKLYSTIYSDYSLS